MLRDPRSQRRYVTLRRAWLDALRGQPTPCALCGALVDTTLPGTHPWGPTIEHRLPIRHIRAQARDNAHALALACDTSMWAVAHKRCQSQQGQQVTSSINRVRNASAPRLVGASRVW